ncbi:MAG: hypothetical protein H6Q14_2293 [Bacteroidetes bacterium]|nr:hypothetical protein [Bacteroidota bacterium]
MKNTLLVDFEPKAGWPFGETLKEALKQDVQVEFCVSNGSRNSPFADLFRILKYFLFPLKMVFRRKGLGRVIGYQQFYALNFAFFCRLFALKKINDLIVLQFIYKKKEGLLGRIYHRYMEFSVKSKYIGLFICFSKEECAHYSELFHLPAAKFQFVRLGMECLDTPSIDAALLSEKYIFSTGRSNRDYDFLVDVLEVTDYKVRIACDTYKRETASNVVIDNDCFNEKMLHYMRNSHCVVIPLKDTTISAGQLVILQAMQMGKPVIITKSKGISDYITDRYSGLLISKDKGSLLKALEKVYSDDDLYQRLVNNGKKEYENHFSMESMASNIGKIVLAS